MNLSIRTKLFGLFLAVSLIPIFIISTISSRLAFEALMQAKESEFSNITVQLAKNLEEKIKVTKNQLKILAGSEILTFFIKSPPRARVFLEDGLYTTFDMYRQNYAIDQITLLKADASHWITSGQMLPETSVADNGKVAWFNDHSQTQFTAQTILQSTDFNWNLHKSFYHVGIPLVLASDKKNPIPKQILGYLVFSLKIQNLAPSIAEIQMGQKGNVMVLDENNLILCSQKNAFLGTVFTPNISPAYLEKNTPILQGLLKITLVADKSEYLVAVSSLKSIIFLVIAMTTSVILLFIPLLSSMLAKPIFKLRDDIIRISKGDLDYEIKSDTNDEIGFLATAFEQMRLALKEKIRALNEEKKIAENANMVKTNFLANVSHELKTPMNGIMGMTGLLNTTDLNASQKRYVLSLKSASERMMGLITNILDFSEIDTLNIPLDMIDFNLRIMVEDIADEMALKAQKKRLKLYSILHEDVYLFVRSDPSRIRQVCANLIDNAIKFTETGEIKIEVSQRSETPETAHIVFNIYDTGIGIEPDKRQSLFEGFSQLDPTSTRKYEGLGLGLSVSQKIITLLKGQIGCDSEPMQGSRFWFELPFKKQKDSPPTPVVEVEPVLPFNLLIVANNDASFLSIKSMLTTSAKATVDVIFSSEEALAKLNQTQKDITPYQVILIDINLTETEMSGEALGKAIRQDPHFEDTLLVAFTATGHRGDVPRIKKIGFQGYLAQPIRQETLIHCLYALLNAKTNQKVNEIPFMTRFSHYETKFLKSDASLADNESEASEDALELNIEEAAKLIERLKKALDLSDPIEIDNNFKMFKTMAPQSMLADLSEHIAVYEYPEALVELDRLSEEFGIKNPITHD